MARLWVNEDDAIIGSVLRDARVRAGKVMVEVAEAADVSYQQLHKYECGINRISLRGAARLCSIIGIDIVTLAARIAASSASCAADFATVERPDADLRAIASVSAELRPEDRAAVLELARHLLARSA